MPILVQLASDLNDSESLRKLATLSVIDASNELISLEPLIIGKLNDKQVDVALALLQLARRSTTLYSLLCLSFQVNTPVFTERCLASRYLNLDSISDSHRKVLLRLAVQCGNVDVVKRWLQTEKFARIAMQPPSPCALESAIQFGRSELFELLVALDSQRAQSMMLGATDAALEQTSLGEALRGKNESIALLLLERGYFDRRHTVAALYGALQSGFSRCALLLLRATTIDTADINHQRCFWSAVSNCTVEVVCALLERFGDSIDVLKPDEKQDKPIAVATVRNMPDLVDVLAARIPNDIDRTSALQFALDVAVGRDNLNVTLHLLRSLKSPGIDIRHIEYSKCSHATFTALIRSEEFRRATCDLDALFTRLVELANHRDEAWPRLQILIENCADRLTRLDSCATNHIDVNSAADQPASSHLLYLATISDREQLALLLLDRASFSFSDDIALATLCEAIRLNRLEIVRRLLDANRRLDTNRRPFDPLPPAPLLRRTPLQPLAAEMAIDFGRYDVLELLIARPEFRPSIENNVLLRALCGLPSLMVAADRTGSYYTLWYYGMLANHVRSVGSSSSIDNRNTVQILSFIERLLFDERFDPRCRFGKLSNVLLEACGGRSERLASIRSKVDKNAPSPPPVDEPFDEQEYRQSRRFGTPPLASRAQIVRLLLLHPSCDPNCVDLSIVQDQDVRRLIESDSRFAPQVSTTARRLGLGFS